MDHLPKLFKLLEITRAQPQYGYFSSGFLKKDESTLAAHHYLVTMISWQIAREANRRGAELDIERVLEFALTHDLGELFGGDIAMPYAAKNPRARKAAKAFELENQRFLSRFFGKDRAYLRKTMEEILDAKSDEALVAKVGDYVEILNYLFYIGRADKNSVAMMKEKLEKLSKKVKSEALREVVDEFASMMESEYLNGQTIDMWFDNKSKK